MGRVVRNHYADEEERRADGPPGMGTRAADGIRHMRAVPEKGDRANSVLADAMGQKGGQIGVGHS